MKTDLVVAVDCSTTASKAVVQDAAGQVVLAGIPGQETTAFPAAVARRKGLTLKLSRRMKEMYPRATRLVQRGQVDVRSVVSHTFPLDRVAEAFAVADAREGLKVVVTPSGQGAGAAQVTR